jgi:hypothetical protein
VTVEQVLEPSQPGSVVLDIGGNIGAAIVAASSALTGAEIEIRRRGAPWDGTHVAVRARHLPNGVMHAALFACLTPGSYQVRVRGGRLERPVTTFEVEGGRVTTAELRFWRRLGDGLRSMDETA